ncbi:MAG: recombinase RecT [Thiotrichales bacterium]|nr:recombinase RecT [Thiotrichales bacterium]
MAQQLQISRAQKQAAVELFSDATTKQADLLQAMRITEKAFQRVLINALMRTPALAVCPRDSIYESVYKCCEWGLVPDGKLGVMVAIRKKGVLTADFWPMVDGMLMRVRKELKDIALQAHNAFEGEYFDDVRGSHPRLTHKPDPAIDRGSEKLLLASYATAHMAGNQVPEVVVMYRSELKPFRKDTHVWNTNPLEMYRKTAFKRLAKRLPVSSGLATLIEEEQGGEYDDTPGDVIEGEAVEVPSQQQPQQPQQARREDPPPRRDPPPAERREDPPDRGRDDDDDLTVGDQGGAQQTSQSRMEDYW